MRLYLIIFLMLTMESNAKVKTCDFASMSALFNQELLQIFRDGTKGKAILDESTLKVTTSVHPQSSTTLIVEASVETQKGSVLKIKKGTDPDLNFHTQLKQIAVTDSEGIPIQKFCVVDIVPISAYFTYERFEVVNSTYDNFLLYNFTVGVNSGLSLPAYKYFAIDEMPLSP